MPATHFTIAATVAMYHPEGDFYENLLSYYDQVDRIYVIDNSDRGDAVRPERWRDLDKIEYHSHHGNKGIAAALNTGAALAIRDGHGYLLTMDQDTRLPAHFVATLLSQRKIWSLEKAGIMAPRYRGISTTKAGVQSVLFTLTSGNLLNLQVYAAVGPFLESLFIDHVDHEYGLRLNQHGYTVVQLNELELAHRPGNVGTIGFAGLKYQFAIHSPVRLYYFVRNGFFVSCLYREKFPYFRRQFLWLFAKEVLKIAVQKEKTLRVRMIFRAIHDYRHHISGPYREK